MATSYNYSIPGVYKSTGNFWEPHIVLLVGGLEHVFYFPYIGNNDANWQTHSLRGVGIPPTTLSDNVVMFYITSISMVYGWYTHTHIYIYIYTCIYCFGLSIFQPTIMTGGQHIGQCSTVQPCARGWTPNYRRFGLGPATPGFSDPRWTLNGAGIFDLLYGLSTLWGPQTIAKLVNNSNVTMVYGSNNHS